MDEQLYDIVKKLIYNYSVGYDVKQDGLNLIYPDNFPLSKKDIISNLIVNYNNLEYQNNQFVDFNVKSKNIVRVYSSFIENGLDKYIYTVPFRDILDASNYSRDGSYSGNWCLLKMFHDYEFNLCNPNINGYSVNLLKNVLDSYFDAYMILALLDCGRIRENKVGKYYYLFGEKNHVVLAISLYTHDIYYYNGRGLQYIGNSYAYLFKNIHLPINVILSSMLAAINDNQNTLENIQVNDELFQNIKEIRESNHYSRYKNSNDFKR